MKKLNTPLTWSPAAFLTDLARGMHCTDSLNNSSKPFGIFMLTHPGMALHGALFIPQSKPSGSSVKVTS